MPGGDRTGPMGFGPMTGRGAGYCAGNPVPGYANPGWGGFGRGGGFGGGRGHRHRNWYYATGMPGWAREHWGVPMGWSVPIRPVHPMAPDELEALKQQARYLEDELRDIKARMAELEAKPSEKTQ